MDYKAVENERIPKPKSSFENYKATIERSVDEFTKDNRFLKAITEGQMSIKLYHSLLNSIFHQVYFSSTSFALAGAMASNVSTPVRSYLMHHAEEEKDHWIWILEDLTSTGFTGPDVRSTFPNWAAQAYLSYGVYLSYFNPIGRLAMANVLEGVSGRFGLQFGGKAMQSLKLQKEQMKFFLVHGELDQGHTHDIEEVLQNENLTPEQWAELEHIAITTAQLYKNIYNYAFDQAK